MRQRGRKLGRVDSCSEVFNFGLQSPDSIYSYGHGLVFFGCSGCLIGAFQVHGPAVATSWSVFVASCLSRSTHIAGLSWSVALWSDAMAQLTSVAMKERAFLSDDPPPSSWLALPSPSYDVCRPRGSACEADILACDLLVIAPHDVCWASCACEAERIWGDVT